MPEESKESKAKKLAAARKKLKEYQQRGANTVPSSTYTDSITNSGQPSSNISERSESELQLNGSVNDINQIENTMLSEPEAAESKEPTSQIGNLNSFTIEQQIVEADSNKSEENIFPESLNSINAIQVLITEKSQLTTELNKFRTLCREKDLEIEELRVQHINATKRVDELTQRLIDLQKQQEQQRLHNAELQHKLAQARAQQEDHSSHINELQQQLALHEESFKKLETDFKDKCNELELSQLRVRQLSDENNITKDNRVETLTQTQFMYEQQIRDLQAMVQQLNQDKEQSNTQYQTYVQQLNAQVQQLNERNNELTEETTKLQEREKELVDHIQQLERDIQRNISKQAEIKEQKEKETTSEISKEHLLTLQERINEFDSERYEFQLKIKSQEDRLDSVQNELKHKDLELKQLKEHLENITSEQPDKAKLLATMESDKVAASRALSQNMELKKQLDELELRFVQLTNDKADLMNRLDSEQFANREMQTHYIAMQDRIRTIDERFKFKDEEMIRLSHENEELKKKFENEKAHCEENVGVFIDNNNHDHDHHHGQKEKHICHVHDENIAEHCGHIHDHESHSNHNDSIGEDFCEEVTEDNSSNSTELHALVNNIMPAKSTDLDSLNMPRIATEEAVEKLQKRFTRLMTQCADLTEEKQRLEHLVTQLQSETETIGEYITLYQTQRRILKQREYEKAAQTAMLQAEREQMRERLTMLNYLVSTLSTQLPLNQHIKEITEALAHTVVSSSGLDTTEQTLSQQNTLDLSSQNVQAPPKDLKSPASIQILHKIQDIITEITENTKESHTITDSVDHLNCCSGKFEVV